MVFSFWQISWVVLWQQKEKAIIFLFFLTYEKIQTHNNGDSSDIYLGPHWKFWVDLVFFLFFLIG